MDNKKWSKRFSTLFWWVLTILPWIYLLFTIIASIVNLHNDTTNLTMSDLVSYCNSTLSNFLSINTFSIFTNLSIPSLSSAFNQLFNVLGISSYTFLGAIFAWMLSVQVYHLIFDVIAWFPNWCHEFIERGRC